VNKKDYADFKIKIEEGHEEVDDKLVYLIQE